MNSWRIGVITLFFIGSVCGARAQNIASLNRGEYELGAKPAQVIFVPPQLTDFERYAAKADQAIVSLSFPSITTDFGSNISLTLTPRALTSFATPNSPQALAAEFHISQSVAGAHNTGAPQSHAIDTLLDFDELMAFKSLFSALATTGMPQSSLADTNAVVNMASKSGMRLRFTAAPQGRIQCLVATEADSVLLLLDSDSIRKWVDALTAAARVLDSAKDSRT